MLLAFIYINPVTIFWTSLIEQQAFFFPLTILYLLFLAESHLRLNKFLWIAGGIAGLAVASEYNGVVLLLVPLLIYGWHRLTHNPNFVRLSALEFTQTFVIFISIAVVIFYAVDPAYWTDPISAASRVISTIGFNPGNTLGNSSGVYGVPTFVGGSSRLVTPWYTPIEVIFFETPFVILVLAAAAPIFVFRRLRRHNFDGLYELGMIGLAVLFVDLALSIPIQHFHDWDEILFFMAPLSLLAAVSGTVILRKARFPTLELSGHPASPPPHITLHAGRRGRANRVRRSQILGATIILILLITSTVGAVNLSSSYTNWMGYAIGKGGPAFTGAYGSTVADSDVGKYISDHISDNESIATLALTAMVAFYAPYERYTQLWQSVNSTYLEGNFRQGYVVIDQWYIQRWGNPIETNDSNFLLLFTSVAPAGYSDLYYVRPLIGSVSTVFATSNQTIYINGTGFGSDPQIVPVSSTGYFDTFISNTTPSMSISIYTSSGHFLWRAGSVFAHGMDGVGLRFGVWQNDQITVTGIGPNVVNSVTGSQVGTNFPIAVGDIASFLVRGPNQTGVSTYSTSIAPTNGVPSVLSVSRIGARAMSPILINGSGFGDNPKIIATSVPGTSTRFAVIRLHRFRFRYFHRQGCFFGVPVQP